MSDQIEPGGSQYGQGSGPPQPQQPYPQQQPYFPPVRPASSRLTVLAAVLSAVFVAATAILAYVAHHPPTSSSATPGPVGNRPAGASGSASLGANGSQAANSTVPAATTPNVAPAPTTTSTSTVPALPQLNPEAINRTFEVYMNALLDHDLSALKSATCPRLRHTEVGVALHGKYVRSWQGKPYQITPGVGYVTISALVGLRNPSTGASAGSVTYSWYVERTSGGHYYVCGFLS